MAQPDDDPFIYGDDEEPDPLDELLDECGLRDDGQCGLAGSEWCDFECPMRNSEHFAGSAAWRAKHDGLRRRG